MSHESDLINSAALHQLRNCPQEKWPQNVKDADVGYEAAQEALRAITEPCAPPWQEIAPEWAKNGDNPRAWSWQRGFGDAWNEEVKKRGWNEETRFRFGFQKGK
jgi:hypothetical protein